jgi:heptosyltransferase-2
MTEYAPKHYLVVGPSWVGDMVMAQTLFAQLQRHPDCHIDVLAPDWSRPLLARMPEVRQALGLPFAHGDLHLLQRRRQGRTLVGQYDHAIVLPNSFKSALIPWWAKIPRRTGWRGEMRYGLLNDVRRLNKQKYPLMVQRFVALGLPADAPVPALESIVPPSLRADQSGVAAALTRFSLSRERPVLGLCPGAEFGPSKRWPDYHYAALARQWLEQGWQVWIFGSHNDLSIANAIVAALPDGLQEHARVLAGATSLAEAIDLMAQTDAVVSNDSGLMHIAAALQKPLVAVYGSTSPDFTPPLSDKAECVSLNLSCSPCFQRECPLGHTNCLVQLPPGMVSQALERVLARSKK